MSRANRNHTILSLAGLAFATGGLVLASLACGSNDETPATFTPGPSAPGVTTSPQVVNTALVSQGTTAVAEPTTVATTEATQSPGPPAAPLSREAYEAILDGFGLALHGDLREADVTGDGQPEVLIRATDECVSCHVKTLFVFRGDVILFQDASEGLLEPVAGGFERVMPLRLPGDAGCCPRWFSAETFMWNGAGFDASDTVRLQLSAQIDPQSAEALGAPVQAATVVLYYSLISRSAYPQAYALLSSGLRANQSFEAWRDRFAATQSVSVESASYNAQTGLVAIRITAIDSTPGGGTIEAAFEGTWTVIEQDGAWRLDAASIAVAP